MDDRRVNYEEAQRWLERADPAIARKRESITEQLDGLKERAKAGDLTYDGAAAWYALCQEMRRLADYYERDLIRKLRADGLTWAKVADAVQAQLSSRQAAQGKWKRLIDPTRRTTNGNMRRGGRPGSGRTRRTPGCRCAGCPPRPRPAGRTWSGTAARPPGPWPDPSAAR